MTDVATEDPSAGPAARTRAGDRTQLRVGRLVKAHGLKGALKIELYTDDPDGRFVPGATFTLQVPETSPWHGKPLTVREFRWMNSHPVAFFDGVDDRTTAESLVRAILWIDEDAAATSDEADAWYDHQLVGLDVVRDGSVVGRVIRVDHLPAQDLLIIRPSGDGDGELLVPFVSAIVPDVDIAGGRLTVTPPPGLFEDLPGEPDESDAASAGSDDDGGGGSAPAGGAEDGRPDAS
ncbi:ribosome maturation factor RimM [Microbacterium invictum]|uniref:Ribosome maturation factor RimM n=1 Tax=Microbacterium invictum TaxID=515415 RepID=A0ABZ0VGK3_9MICO|nr:ribosome maturation factor RimM [Microbacterium invictum]WQB71942.1 ribosome maturation factor RimM [Microbacterium invictum]